MSDTVVLKSGFIRNTPLLYQILIVPISKSFTFSKRKAHDTCQKISWIHKTTVPLIPLNRFFLKGFFPLRWEWNQHWLDLLLIYYLDIFTLRTQKYWKYEPNIADERRINVIKISDFMSYIYFCSQLRNKFDWTQLGKMKTIQISFTRPMIIGSIK